ncbi:tRNA dihydrouridine synthase [Spiromyces aspiralis]|uniref:tRNA dihydrouridine synthase n=1 Tax=Spiromyces aspiralis TaxID=68401 RepID=A0ACC1HUL4_9FUNG|nr:tRNA dihydrouridine synthase [Spiromyces aspiralis]
MQGLVPVPGPWAGGAPVVANGSVFSLKEAEELRERTGVDGIMSARGLLRNPALFAGHEVTPLECIKRYAELAMSYGTTTFIFHHHLMFMMEGIMSSAEKCTFNVLSSIPAILEHLEQGYGIVPSFGEQHGRPLP